MRTPPPHTPWHGHVAHSRGYTTCLHAETHTLETRLRRLQHVLRAQLRWQQPRQRHAVSANRMTMLNGGRPGCQSARNAISSTHYLHLARQLSAEAAQNGVQSFPFLSAASLAATSPVCWHSCAACVSPLYVQLLRLARSERGLLYPKSRLRLPLQCTGCVL